MYMKMIENIMAKRQAWVRPYRRSVRDAEIQHQFAPDGIMAPMAVAMVAVITGTTHIDKQMRTFLVRDTPGMYTFSVIVRRVICSKVNIKPDLGLAWVLRG
jgi:hypothetical protein